MFVFKDEYSLGMQTGKKHSRSAVVDIWMPDAQMWMHGMKNVGLSESSCSLDEEVRERPSAYHSGSVREVLATSSKPITVGDIVELLDSRYEGLDWMTLNVAD